jgi:hypothetical protein
MAVERMEKVHSSTRSKRPVCQLDKNLVLKTFRGMSISEGKIPVQTVLLVSNVPANYDGIHVSSVTSKNNYPP